MDEFKKEYPYARFEKFYVDVDDHGHIGVFVTVPNLGMVNARSKAFMESKYAQNYLYGNYMKIAMGPEVYKKVAAKKASDIVAFKAKYPNANIKDFDFEVDWDMEEKKIKSYTYYKITEDDEIDITSDEFKKKYIKKLGKPVVVSEPVPSKYNKDGWPIIWSNNGTTTPFGKYLTPPNNPDRKGWGHHEIIDMLYNRPIDVNICDFKVYVNSSNYFMSKLPVISQDWSVPFTDANHDIKKVDFDYKKVPYFAMIAGAYVASYLSGISLKNLTDKDTPEQIRSIAKYHLYFQISRFIKDPKLLDKYNLSEVFKHIPTKHKMFTTSGTDEDGNHEEIKGTTNLSNSDYRSFISYTSDGLTEIGQDLFQQSVESFTYAILGSQANTRWSITGKGAKSLQTQDAFRKIVKSTIVQDDVTVTISNMRRAITDTNVILNMSITPGIILIPSDFTILKNPIPGYNNILEIATDSMKFGTNKTVNYVGIRPKPKPKPVVETKSKPEVVDKPKPIDHLDEIPKPKPKPVIVEPQVTRLSTHNKDLIIYGVFGTGLVYLLMLLI